jgi:hypothetical protein
MSFRAASTELTSEMVSQPWTCLTLNGSQIIIQLRSCSPFVRGTGYVSDSALRFLLTPLRLLLTPLLCRRAQLLARLMRKVHGSIMDGTTGARLIGITPCQCWTLHQPMTWKYLLFQFGSPALLPRSPMRKDVGHSGAML